MKLRVGSLSRNACRDMPLSSSCMSEQPHSVCTEASYQEAGGDYAVMGGEERQMEVHSSASSHSFARFYSGLPHSLCPLICPCLWQQDCPSQRCLQPSKIHVLVLVLHGGNILDTGSGTHAWRPAASSPTVAVVALCPAGEQNSKQGDENTLNGVFDSVMRVHYPAALGRIAVRMVPCPAVCVDAFSLVSK